MQFRRVYISYHMFIKLVDMVRHTIPNQIDSTVTYQIRGFKENRGNATLRRITNASCHPRVYGPRGRFCEKSWRGITLPLKIFVGYYCWVYCLPWLYDSDLVLYSGRKRPVSIFIEGLSRTQFLIVAPTPHILLSHSPLISYYRTHPSYLIIAPTPHIYPSQINNKNK